MKFELSKTDLSKTVEELRAGLGHLTPPDNFNGFLWEGTIPAATVKQIPNKMRDGTIPKYFMVLMADGANQLVRTTAWTTTFLYVKNLDAVNDMTATIMFFR